MNTYQLLKGSGKTAAIEHAKKVMTEMEGQNIKSEPVNISPIWEDRPVPYESHQAIVRGLRTQVELLEAANLRLVNTGNEWKQTAIRRDNVIGDMDRQIGLLQESIKTIEDRFQACAQSLQDMCKLELSAQRSLAIFRRKYYAAIGRKAKK